jgi:hypothetical protein
VKQRQKGGVVKYHSVWYIFYVVVKIVNLRFRTHIKLVLYNLAANKSKQAIFFLSFFATNLTKQCAGMDALPN